MELSDEKARALAGESFFTQSDWAGVIKLPILGNETIQINEYFEGFAL